MISPYLSRLSQSYDFVVQTIPVVRRTSPYLSQSYDFAPLAIETTGVLGPAFETLIAELGRRISERTGERRETQWLRQRVALAVVRGNAAAVCR